MSRIWEPQPREVLQGWVKAVTEEAHRLNDWETTFMILIAIRVENGASLTQTQEETLEGIYDKKTSHP